MLSCIGVIVRAARQQSRGTVGPRVVRETHKRGHVELCVCSSGGPSEQTPATALRPYVQCSRPLLSTTLVSQAEMRCSSPATLCSKNAIMMAPSEAYTSRVTVENAPCPFSPTPFLPQPLSPSHVPSFCACQPGAGRGAQTAKPGVIWNL